MAAIQTKQSQTRDSVVDLIESLGVGSAIPSERQLSADLGVSRLTVRAALDDLVREGHLVRRRGSGTFVAEPKIAQQLTMTSFTDDMRKRGMRPGSRTLSLEVTMAGAYLGRCLYVSPSERIVVARRLRMADSAMSGSFSHRATFFFAAPVGSARPASQVLAFDASA